MLKTRRRPLQFESLEEKVLLSAAMADPSATIHRSAVKPFLLNGSVQGLPAGSFVSKGLEVKRFPISGRLGSMGKVHGFILLSNKMVTRGALPDLTNSLLIVTNQNGSVLLGVKPSTMHHYSFQIIGVTTKYKSVSGSGILTIAPSPTSFNLIIELHSARK